MNSSEKGLIGEIHFLLWATKKGYYAAKAPERAPYDFFLDTGNSIERVQVKYRTPNKMQQIELKLKPILYNKNNRVDYTIGNIDAFAIYNSVTEQIAYVPVKDLPLDQGYVFFNCKGKGRQNGRLFEDYI
jgi:PD-(D/E)XK endonuclease